MSIRKYKDISPTIGNDCFIDDSAQVIGKVTIGDDSSIWPLVSIRGDVNSISIGKNTNVQDNSVLHATHENFQSPKGGFPLVIGDNVTIGHGVILHGCTIGNNCLVGMGSSVLDGAIVEDNVLIAAGSLVAQNKKVITGYLWMGRPAKPIRKLTEGELSWLEYSAGHYVKLKNDYI
jgi:carbonic anhydrase/acetyltransferase-like protein (isoleucine patch superfamily)